TPAVGTCVLQNTVEISADTSCLVTSVLDISSGLLLYPNPTENSVSMSNNLYGTVKVLSIDGSTVSQKTKSNSELTLDLSGAKAGPYYIILISEQET
ncbi:MAG: hypothetical protein ACJAZ2_000917, partial [Glaciecola sp.]